MSGSNKLSVGLVEANVTVSSNAENLNVDTAKLTYLLLVCLAECVNVLCLTVGNVCISLVNVDLIEEVLVHKVTVALIVVGSYGIVFVKVYGGYLGEVELACLVVIDEAIVKTDGGISRCKTENAVGLLAESL